MVFSSDICWICTNARLLNIRVVQALATAKTEIRAEIKQMIDTDNLRPAKRQRTASFTMQEAARDADPNSADCMISMLQTTGQLAISGNFQSMCVLYLLGCNDIG